MATVTITTQYSYQAWQQAHAALRSNVEAVEAVEHGESITVTFRAVDTERWPVAAKFYRGQARHYHNLARHARQRGDRVGAAMHAETARLARVNLSDAKTGMVTDPQTMQAVMV